MTVGHSDDPALAGHLNGAVQRFGLLSAAAVVDRYVGLVDRTVGIDGQGGELRTGTSVDADSPVERAAWLVQGFLRVIDMTATLVESRPDTTGRSEIELIVLPEAAPGGTSEASVWLHNPTEEPSQVEVRATAMTSAEGAAISDHASTLSPAVMALAAHESRRLAVRLALPEDQPIGRYHGFLLLVGNPGTPIALQVEVRSSEVSS